MIGIIGRQRALAYRRFMRLPSLHIVIAIVLAATFGLSNPALAQKSPNPGEQVDQAVETAIQGAEAGFGQIVTSDYGMRVTADDLADVSRNVARRASKRYRQLGQYLDDLTDGFSKSLPFRVLGPATIAMEAAGDVFGPMAGGDYQRATAGVGAIITGEAFTAGVSCASGVIGRAVGGALGSCVPVVGTAVGQTIGGAMGKVAGGFIAATAYDLLMKDSVTGAFSGAIAPLFGTGPDIVLTWEDYLRDRAAEDMKPIWEAYHRFSGEFGLRSVELYPPPTLLRTSLPGPLTALPTPPTDAEILNDIVIDELNTFEGVSVFGMEIWPAEHPDWVQSYLCTIEDARVWCKGGISTQFYTRNSEAEGRLELNVVDFDVRDVDIARGADRCEEIYHASGKTRLEYFGDGRVSGIARGLTQEYVSGTCPDRERVIQPQTEEIEIRGTWLAQ